MTSRLLELEDELTGDEQPDADAEEQKGFSVARGRATRRTRRQRRVARTSVARALGPAPLAASRPGRRSTARALAAARPIRYTVPGSVPLVTAPGTMNAWAAATAALLSWRERQVMAVEDAVSRLGPRWLDLVHRNQGLPTSEKAAFLAAVGLVADPPVRYGADDLEMLLRQNGPLWITDDDRGARLFSPKAYLVTGIRATGTRDPHLDVIDVATGRSGPMRLSRLARKFGASRGGRTRFQVLHLGQGAPNGGRLGTNGSADRAAVAPPPPVSLSPAHEPAMQQGMWSSAMNPAVIVAAVGLGWTVVKEVLTATPDITITRARMDGKKHPNDDASWDSRGQWKQNAVEVKRGRIENLAGDQQSVDFKVEYQYNGHSLGNIIVHTLNPNDAFGWKLKVDQDIIPRADLTTGGDNPVVAMEVSFEYRHSAPLRNDVVKRARLVLYADGRWEQESLPEGQSLPSAMNGGASQPTSPVGPAIAGAGVGWQVVKEILNPTSDITVSRATMKGKKHPGDDASWDTRGTWTKTEVEVKRGRIENLAGDQQSVDFKVEFQHNGHSLGHVFIHTLNPNDAFGWKLKVDEDIVMRDDLTTGGDNPVVAAEISFHYYHSAPLRNDVVKRARLIIYADGRWEQETLPEGQSIAEGTAFGRA